MHQLTNQPVSNLVASFEFLQTVLHSRLKGSLPKPDLPVFFDDGSTFSAFLNRFQPDFEEYILLLLALAPRLQPDFFSDILSGHFPAGADLPAFGGVRSGNHRGIVPTGETAQFVLAGNNLSERLAIAGRLAPGNRLDSHNILRLETLPPAEPPMSGRLLPDPEWVEYVTTGHVSTPRFSTDFPAEKLETDLSWDDLILPGATLANVLEIESWLRHQYTLRHAWKLGARLKPGFRVLFHGPPGTGKTLCAALLGKRAGMPVFRIDLSMVISKYIGETEKNLSRLFDKAQDKQWILFFDEADALFGKRTDIRDAHDKYANQEVSYLLQRIEQFPGLVILASNFKTNLDDAFMRRFQTVVYFPMPRTDERLQLWLKSLPLQHAVLAPDVDLKHFAERYELSGAAILNATQYACLQALERNSNILTAADLTEGIRREFNKDGKPMP